jgi:hypothetical protein
MQDDVVTLQKRLDKARRRVDDDVPYSPDWDAATELVAELERRLAMAECDTREVQVLG